MKIIALLPVKNEEWCLRHCLRSLRFCDEILAIDDNSEDATPHILREFNATILQFETASKIGWKEYAIRSYLVEQARLRNATHIVAIDGDEMFSDAFVKDARTIISQLKPGNSLSMPWINVSGDDETMEPTISKIFLMADDGHSVFESGFIHIPRVPSIKPAATLNTPYAVLHFQYLNKRRNGFKKIWYMMSELLNGKRSGLRINASYGVTKELTPQTRDLSQFIQTPLPDPREDKNIWQEEAIAALFATHGYERFEPLDIWEMPELSNQFIQALGRTPRPHIPPRWLLKLNAAKNSLRYAIRSLIG